MSQQSTGRLNLLPLCATAAVLAACLSADPARAAALKPQPAAVEIPAEPHRDVSPSAGRESDDCPRVRRRLWVEGEGWIVRRVALCR